LQRKIGHLQHLLGDKGCKSQWSVSRARNFLGILIAVSRSVIHGSDIQYATHSLQFTAKEVTDKAPLTTVAFDKVNFSHPTKTMHFRTGLTRASKVRNVDQKWTRQQKAQPFPVGLSACVYW
jgi:hypothetical protein